MRFVPVLTTTATTAFNAFYIRMLAVMQLVVGCDSR